MNMQMKIKEMVTPPDSDSSEFLAHFSDTYMALRIFLCAFAFSMPIVLYAWGKLWHGLDLQPSMSAYFWVADSDQCATFPMRTFFVGYLCAIGACLLVYRGLTLLENRLLDVAAICAFVVASFPERITPSAATSNPQIAQLFENCPAIHEWAIQQQPSLPIHFIAANILFLSLAIVAWFCAKESLKYLPDPDGKIRNKYQRFYKTIGFVMAVFPVLGFGLAYLIGEGSNKVFFIEAFGIVTFGVYWWKKTTEIKRSRTEIRERADKKLKAKEPTNNLDEEPIEEHDAG